MYHKDHQLCLENCDVHLKLITTDIQMAQHYDHDYQAIEEIYNRINEPNNKIICNYFMNECSLDSQLSQNDNCKNEILKGFAMNVSQYFEEIAKQFYILDLRNLTEHWIDHKRIVRALQSISPEYKYQQLSKIEGSFPFLKQGGLKQLHLRILQQKEQNFKAINEIQNLVTKIDKFFAKKHHIQPFETPTLCVDQDQALLKEPQIKMNQVNKIEVQYQNQLNQIQPKQLIQWEEDGRQHDGSQIIQAIQGQFKVNFEKDRKLIIEKITNAKISYQDLIKMVDLCLDFQPNNLSISVSYVGVINISPFGKLKASPLNLSSLNIDLRNNKIADISPLCELKFLINLTNLTINLGNTLLKQIFALRELKALTNLTKLILDLRNNKIQDILPLCELSVLINLVGLSINLIGNGLANISPLQELKSLTKLIDLSIDLRYNQLVVIQPFCQLKALINLNSLIIDMRLFFSYYHTRYNNSLLKGSPQVFTSYSQLKDHFQ